MAAHPALYPRCRSMRSILAISASPGDTQGQAHPFHCTQPGLGGRPSIIASTGEHCQALPASGCIIPARSDLLDFLLHKFSPNPAWVLGIPTEALYLKQKH